MTNRKITLAQLGTVEDRTCDELDSALTTLGYVVKRATIEKFVRKRPSDDLELHVLYLNAMHEDTRAQIYLKKLQQIRRYSLLLVGEHSERNLYTSLESSADFGRWPCPLSHLEIRLKRLSRVTKLAFRQKSAPSKGSDPIQKLIGKSSSFIRSIQQINKVSPHDSPVLITGETGTGKELTARAIHYQSPRRDGPFIPVNCGALPESLAISELFGHEAGAFTDAKKKHIGLVEQANGGTLFLDEVDSLPVDSVQPVLLRVLEDMELRRLGSQATHRLDIRIISASNTQLIERIDQKEFRADLYYRLNILRVDLPPLRRRENDIKLLSQHFLDNLAAQYGLQKQLSSRGLDQLMGYPWPGNVRELENFIFREYLQSEDETLDCRELTHSTELTTGSEDSNIPLDQPFTEAKQTIVKQFEKAYLTAMMEKFHGNVTHAARSAGKERRSFGRLIKKHGIDVSTFRVR